MSANQASSHEILSNSNVQRPLVDFPPSIWGDQFLNYHFVEMAYGRREKKVHILKEKVKRELLGLADDPLMQLKLIDAIQRLDVAYHFEMEIEEALQHIYDDHQHHLQDDNLYNVSLFFRILRQDGFNVSSDVFNKFKDDNGNFKGSLITDVRGMLELYEAAQLSVRGEEVLDEALELTTTQLKAIAASIKQYPLAAQVSRALEQKLRCGIPRLEAKHFMSIYQDMASHNKALLKLAKIDFNLLQSLHMKGSQHALKWKSLVRGYFKEAQWCTANYIPTVEEHYDVSILVTSTYHACATISCLGMDETVTKETFQWIGEDPKIASKMVKALSIVCRLMDDIVSHKFEQERVHVASSVECYMKQFGISEEKACELLRKEVANAWKDMNEAFLRPTEMPKPILMRLLNLARFMDVIYSESDAYSHLGVPLTDAVTSFLIDELPNDDEEDDQP
ncbi:hypothetical protein FNV43_RR20915 [Rhamnella rubrinervis]|uniref:Uncharacterized protein n=1 Tax=Rhamnella rubrinervis TaxID=2594499 RepID=A0A8K0GTV5_9ROSA|nr:hypothetical protein FNV43_RR20915 [Rhamnella rubrinervis]